MFKTINDIFYYKSYFEHFTMTRPYEFIIDVCNVVIWYTTSYCYDLSLGISCDEIFYYKLVDHINNFTFTDDININLNIANKNNIFGLNITYYSYKLCLYLITSYASGSKSTAQFLSRLPIQINILSIDSKIYYLHAMDLVNLPTTLTTIKLRNHGVREFKKNIEKLPFGCEVELSDDF